MAATLKSPSSTTAQAFSASDEAYEALKQRLRSEETQGLAHGDLEKLIQTDGREILRQMLQSHVDLRAQNDVGAPPQGSDGVVRTHRRLNETRMLMTVFGQVVIGRIGHTAHDATTLYPLDAELNLPPRLHSSEVQRHASIAASQVSFDAVIETVQSNTGAHLAKRQALEIVVDAADDFNAFYEANSKTSIPAAKTDIIAMTTDAKGIVMRVEDLREATRKKAEQREAPAFGAATPNKNTRLQAKRMAQVASVYAVAPYVRTPEDVIKELRPAQDTEGPPRPRPLNKRVWASVRRDAGEVVDDMFEEALRRDPNQEHPWVVLLDGSTTQMGLVLACAKHHNVNVTIIVDIIHVLEYLWGAARVFCNDDRKEIDAWIAHRFAELLRGHSSNVAAGIRRSATFRGLTDAERRPADVCADYLLKYKDFLRYDKYLAAGYPIATGVIEGACRYLIKDRMDITGARWGLAGAEAVLKLRALRASGDFDDYWKFHEQQELQRNHASHYANGSVPKLSSPKTSGRSRGHLRVVK